jgi:hypothetical protein
MSKEIGDGPQGTDMRLGISWNQLGVAYMINDDWTMGEECFRKSINTLKKTDDFKRYKLSLPLVNLGYAWWLTGKFDEAVIALHEGLKDRAAAFGENDRESFMFVLFLQTRNIED